MKLILGCQEIRFTKLLSIISVYFSPSDRLGVPLKGLLMGVYIYINLGILPLCTQEPWMAQVAWGFHASCVMYI